MGRDRRKLLLMKGDDDFPKDLVTITENTVNMAKGGGGMDQFLVRKKKW